MIIYKVTNLKNNKVYIGQSTRSLNERKRFHYLEAKHIHDNTYFHNALRKYQPEDFKWEILESDIDNQVDLDKLETHYIQQYQSTNRDKGYNLKSGGSGGGINDTAIKKKIGLKTKERWQNKEIAAKMLEGLQKGTQTIKTRSKNYYEERICIVCQKPFKVKPYYKKRICSKECVCEYNKVHNNGLSVALKINEQQLQQKRKNQLQLIKNWIVDNKNVFVNLKMNRLSCIFEPLKQLLNVKDERSISIILGTKSRKEFVTKLSKMYAELVGNNEN